MAAARFRRPSSSYSTHALTHIGWLGQMNVIVKCHVYVVVNVRMARECTDGM
jgi:hypothetical protein